VLIIIDRKDNTLILADVIGDLEKLAGLIQGLVVDLGYIAITIGIVVAVIMRATAFGSERRIAISNAAIACAIVAALVLLLANPVYQWLSTNITNSSPIIPTPAH
jgi:hypothetical protein